MKNKFDVAFNGEKFPRKLDIEEISKWEPKKITKMGHSTYFEVDGTFVSMKTEDYNLVFN